MANLNSALTPNPVVTCFSWGDQVSTGFTGNVVMSLSTNPTGATLGGTTTVAASSGVATFTNLTLNRSGKGFRLRATGAGIRRPVISEPFDIPTRCAFTTQPSYTLINTDFGCVVTVRDGANTTDTAYNGDVTLSLYSNEYGATLSGTTTVTAVSGVATFSALQIDKPGSYTLLATASEVSTAYPPTGVVSSSFNVGQEISIVQGNSGAIYGYSASLGIGSISPTTFSTGTILECYIDTTVPDTEVSVFKVSGTISQTIYTNLLPVSGGNLLLASATYTNPSGASQWEWTTNQGLFGAAPGTTSVVTINWVPAP